MRIDAYNKINQMQSVSKINKVTSKKTVSQTDKLELSQAGKDYQVAKTAVSEASDIRMDLVNDIKERLANGTYNVSDEDLADKLLERYCG
ncbi:MAG: flagellar biosynthesis anti-sigma factor FlgM [Lachnospiraceae bacterium]|nr:flagellar biosynthesis anti-sigma factor FlgM [Lachnospiraceae bacterium]